MSLVSPPASSDRPINGISIQTHILWTLAHRLFPTPLIILHSQLWLINPLLLSKSVSPLVDFPCSREEILIQNQLSRQGCDEQLLNNSLLSRDYVIQQPKSHTSSREAMSPGYYMSSQRNWFWTQLQSQVKVLHAHPSSQQRFKQNESKTKHGDSLSTPSSILQGRLWYDLVISLGLSMIFSFSEPLQCYKHQSGTRTCLHSRQKGLPCSVCCRLVLQGYLWVVETSR